MNDFSIFKDKTFQGLLEDIYTKSNNRAELIETLIEDLRSLVETPEEAVMVIPMIVQYLDVGVKNDRHLIDLSNTIERHKKGLLKVQTTVESSNLHDEELQHLIEQEEKRLLEEMKEDIKAIEPPENDIEE